MIDPGSQKKIRGNQTAGCKVHWLDGAEGPTAAGLLEALIKAASLSKGVDEKQLRREMRAHLAYDQAENKVDISFLHLDNESAHLLAASLQQLLTSAPGNLFTDWRFRVHRQVDVYGKESYKLELQYGK